LTALNEALVETLSREDYEQAAYLRDEIKSLTEGSDDEEKK
jgi:protein arginine kinase activator